MLVEHDWQNICEEVGIQSMRMLSSVLWPGTLCGRRQTLDIHWWCKLDAWHLASYQHVVIKRGRCCMHITIHARYHQPSVSSTLLLTKVSTTCNSQYVLNDFCTTRPPQIFTLLYQIWYVLGNREHSSQYVWQLQQVKSACYTPFNKRQ
jgi:hypothetical protein